MHRQGGEGSKAKATAIFVLPRTAYVLFVLEARKAAAKSNEVGTCSPAYRRATQQPVSKFKARNATGGPTAQLTGAQSSSQ